MDVGWRTRKQSVALKSRLPQLVHWTLSWLLSMNVISICDHSMYYWFVYVNIEPSLVVGWFEVKLLSGLRFLWSMLCEEGDRVVNYRNRVDWEAMCGLMSLWYELYEYDMCEPVFPDTLRDVMWSILETWDVFKKKRSFRKLVLHAESAFKFASCLFTCLNV